MILPAYTLFTDICEDDHGWWRFVLLRSDGGTELDVTDCEPGVSGLRLELLALVRGLEALDQPSRVTLVTASRHVRYGIEHGLPQWRENGWTWDAYDQFQPIRHADLWQRLARAGTVHHIRCAAVARKRSPNGQANTEQSSRRMTRTHFRLDAVHGRPPAPHRSRLASRVRHVLQAILYGG
jgi:ribonuclease HI